MNPKPILSLVVPCFNEEEALPSTAEILTAKLAKLIQNGQINRRSFLCFVDDGSSDATWEIISRLHDENSSILGIKLAGNSGHQNALLCGLLAVKEKSDITVSIDADLQDDIDAIDEMIEKYLDGCDIVYGVRSSRKKDTFFKRFTAESFYKIMQLLGGKVVFNHADYRLMSHRALNALERYEEVNLFLRGIVPMLGFKTAQVAYARRERTAGQSKYPLRKMVSFAVQGITSLSVKPMRMIAAAGFLMFFLSVVMMIYFIVLRLTGHTVAGWATLAVSVWGIGGLIEMSIGICGEYIGKIYLETKRRPRYIIESVLKKEEK